MERSRGDGLGMRRGGHDLLWPRVGRFAACLGMVALGFLTAARAGEEAAPVKVLSMRTAKRLKAAGPRGGSYIADKGKQFVCVSVAAKLEDDMGVNSLRKSLQVKAKVAGRAETFTSQGEGDDRQGYNSGVVFTVLTHWKKLQPKTKGKEGGDEPAFIPYTTTFFFELPTSATNIQVYYGDTRLR